MGIIFQIDDEVRRFPLSVRSQAAIIAAEMEEQRPRRMMSDEALYALIESKMKGRTLTFVNGPGYEEYMKAKIRCARELM